MSKPMYEIRIVDAGGDFPCGDLKVWIDGAVAYDYELSLFCQQKGIFATADELYATAQEMIKKCKEAASYLEVFQMHQEYCIP